MAQDHGLPWLDPLWRRVVMIGACAIWAIVELVNGNTFWFSMVGVVTVYGAYAYLYNYTPSTAAKPEEK